MAFKLKGFDREFGQGAANKSSFPDIAAQQPPQRPADNPQATAQAIAGSAYYGTQGSEQGASLAGLAQTRARQAIQAKYPSVAAPMQQQRPNLPASAGMPEAPALQMASPGIIGPNGQVIAPMTRDVNGQLVSANPYVSGFQRSNVDPYAQRLAQTGDTQMQRGLAGATLAGIPQVEAARMRAAQIDRSGFDQQAMQQNALAAQGNQAIGMLQGAAQGNAPSAALIQQQQGIEAAQRAQMAMAASARGGADQRAAAMRQGQMAGADMAMQGVGQASALRAQEMAQARGQLVGAVGQQQQLAQGQGMNQANIAQAQAGFGQQAGLANQQAGMQAQLANQQGYLGASGVDVGMVGQGAGIYGQGAGLGMAGLGFNNQQYQADIDTQMRLLEAQSGRYNTNQQVMAQRHAADQAQDAAMMGAGLNALGTLGSVAFGGMFAPAAAAAAPAAAAANPYMNPSYIPPNPYR